MGKFKTWDEVRKDFNFTLEEEAIMRIESEIIEETIKFKDEFNSMTNKEKNKVLEESILKIKNIDISSFVELLVPLGYTLKMVSINE